MTSDVPFQAIASGVAVCLGISYYYLSSRRSASSKPPGPRGWPIIGNLLNVPTQFEWFYWATYKDLYGPISYTTVLGREIVILNTLEACNEMLEKKSSVYSGRPIMPFAGEIVGWDQQLLFVPFNGNHFRAMRKLAHHHLGTKVAASQYHEVQETEVKHLVSRLRGTNDSEGLVKNLRITIGAILLRMSHGYTTRTDGNDPIVNLVEVASQDFYQATKPGAWFVDIFPWLKHVPAWMPGAGFKKTGAKFRKTNIDQTDKPYDFVVKEMGNNTALPSFTSNALRTQLTPDEKFALKFIAAALYGGGLDTMTGATTVFFLAMIIYPDIQRKIHEELDRVVGTGRLPNMRDQEHLPFLGGVIKEVSRWSVTVPGGVPHAATEDDVFNGYYIRKGTIVINNLWAIAHDPANYTSPMTFDPTRFLGPTPELDPASYTFGFGRRRCPGIEVAESTVYIVLATCLSVFRVSGGKDEKGNELPPPKEEFQSGAVSHPKPFKCVVEPRSAEAVNLLQMLGNDLVERPPSQL
ncbi:cytochrome P450 oxidoreductase [Roridomyces roridus]|uniref:Cytochrome P450 oxidoreductase n=1 Tax=Roridomyces roridus TaxID=1738132 RepID=A0AAD7CCT3_9AGAR|nr:cytochrome P450 oxidoreductase [Roridomyces roridus]